jgi:hypothetical protein
MMPLTFTSRINAAENPGYSATMPVPTDVAEELLTLGTRRILFFAKGIESRRALQSDGIGGYYVMLGKEILRDLAVGPGAMIEVTLAPDPNPNAVDLCEELEAVLDQDEEFGAFWKGLTPGRQRGLAHYVTTAKSMDTRIKRALEIATKAKNGTLYMQRNSKKKEG